MSVQSTLQIILAKDHPHWQEEMIWQKAAKAYFLLLAAYFLKQKQGILFCCSVPTNLVSHKL